jgi:hypothetical protein
MSTYQRVKNVEGITGIYKELMKLQERIDELQQYLNLLNKYTGHGDTIDRTKRDLEKLNAEKDSLLKRLFYCPECGKILRREERIYCKVGFNWEEDYPSWDVYICENCEYFTWDVDSRRSSGPNWIKNIHSDPRYRGTMDGHPRFDNDHIRFHEQKKLIDIEEEEK